MPVKSKKPVSNDKVIDEFLAKKAEIDLMLERLKSLSDDHFETNPESLNWGHVSQLDGYTQLLKQVSDQAFQEGEYA